MWTSIVPALPLVRSPEKVLMRANSWSLARPEIRIESLARTSTSPPFPTVSGSDAVSGPVLLSICDVPRTSSRATATEMSPAFPLVWVCAMIAAPSSRRRVWAFTVMSPASPVPCAFEKIAVSVPRSTTERAAVTAMSPPSRSRE